MFGAISAAAATAMAHQRSLGTELWWYLYNKGGIIMDGSASPPNRRCDYCKSGYPYHKNSCPNCGAPHG